MRERIVAVVQGAGKPPQRADELARKHPRHDLDLNSNNRIKAFPKRETTPLARGTPIPGNGSWQLPFANH